MRISGGEGNGERNTEIPHFGRRHPIAGISRFGGTDRICAEGEVHLLPLFVIISI
ncbi:MAG: hypothetical protein K6E42_02055 [Synergistes sp.]|nr:hypothetical protein [Synergistes sp.]